MKNKLYRSTKNCVIGGVCGGIAEYFDIDPTLVRLLAILIFFLGGSGIVAYIIGWIIIPQNPNLSSGDNLEDKGKIKKEEDKAVKKAEENLSEERSKGDSKRNRDILLGVILIIAGLIFMGSTFFPWITWIAWGTFWPVIIIVVGLVIMIRAI